MQRTRLHLGKDEHQVFELPEGMSGSELKRFAKRKKLPLLRRKMKRTKFPNKIQIRKEKKLHIVAQYLKNNPELKRTKFPNHENS